MRKVIWLLGFLVMGMGLAEAQTATVTAKMTFNPPPTRTDGSNITGQLFYVVLGGSKGQAQKSRLLTTTVPNATSISVPNVTPGTCFQLVSVENNIEGPASVESCLQAAPGPATNLVITLVITVGTSPSP